IGRAGPPPPPAGGVVGGGGAAAGVAASQHGVDDMLAFATSAVRDAANVTEVLGRVRAEAGVDLQVLSGQDEARLTFLAVRRWFGWSAGRLLVLDIGGGSLEIAAGLDEEPDTALSLPLGAGRLTRDRFSADPPPAVEVDDLRAYAARRLAGIEVPEWDRAAATSKTFRSLARLAGAAPAGAGLRVPRALTRTGLHQVLGFIQRIPSVALAEMDGVSPQRAHQLLAGAVVAEETMIRLGVDRVEICPWALREGVILRRLDTLPPS
ncbi:MAG: hypothetical protein IRY85_16375, partial [Micromonosporaceae bacterium]|nr:hypothetical protein [Micromonosporaceae bacterium]